MESTQVTSLYYGERGRIDIRLTPEQEAGLQKLKQDEIANIWNTGFIQPEQISSYFCQGCGQSYKESPKVEASISRFGSGEINTFASYTCNHCDKIIYSSHLPTPGGIPVKFIVYDETGDYKRPTPDSIDSLLLRIEQQAKKGYGRDMEHPNYDGDLETAKYWAAKIDYDINQRVGQITETFRENYVKRLKSELPDLVRDIIDKGYGFRLEEIEGAGISDYEGTGLAERMEQLFITIKLMTPQEAELKKDIVRIFESYWRMLHTESERLLEEKRGLEERIASFEKNLMEVRIEQSEFIRKSGLNNEQVQEARDNLISDWPLKDEPDF